MDLKKKKQVIIIKFLSSMIKLIRFCNFNSPWTKLQPPNKYMKKKS